MQIFVMTMGEYAHFSVHIRPSLFTICISACGPPRASAPTWAAAWKRIILFCCSSVISISGPLGAEGEDLDVDVVIREVLDETVGNDEHHDVGQV